MVSSIYKKTFSVLMKRPFRLWGISLLAEFLCLVAYAGFIGVPAAAFCAALLLSASMSMIFLNSYRTGLEPKTSYLFASFKKDRILRVLGGMAWMQLWIFPVSYTHLDVYKRQVHLCIAEQVPILPACVRMAVCLNCRSCTAFCAADLNVARFM